MDSAYDPSGKFQRVSSGEMQLPAQCGSCGKTYQEEGFVDTKIDADFYGVIYFCCDCAFELTTVFAQAPYHTMRNRILELEADSVAKDARIASLERALDGISASRLSDRGVTVIGDTVIGADVPAEPADDGVTAPDDSGEGTASADSAESITDDGPVLAVKSQRRNRSADPILDL